MHAVRSVLAGAGHPLYLGCGPEGVAFARPQQAVLVLGPPRSGKTSAVVVPTVLSAGGAVVSTSTKTDVMDVTAAARSELGRCWLYDPSGSVPCPSGIRPVRWSPVPASADWDAALLLARALVRASHPASGVGDWNHWQERAEALLAPLLHAAALGGAGLGAVMGWVNRRQLGDARAILEGEPVRAPGTVIAGDVLAGLAATEPRELSGIWSTAAGALAAYRSAPALAAADAPNFDARAFVQSGDTVYVCGSSRHQALLAPLVIGLLEEIRSATYARPPDQIPVVLALDEVANIAPLPDLPAMVSEGGGQGILTLACFQDLSQARARWGVAADGFLSLFGTTMILPGIGDLRTLEAVSALCGDIDVPLLTATAPWWPSGVASPSVSITTRRQRRVPVDAVAYGQAGTAYVLDGQRGPSRVVLTPWYDWPPFRDVGSRSRLTRGMMQP